MMAVYVCIVTAEFCLMYLLKFTELLCLNCQYELSPILKQDYFNRETNALLMSIILLNLNLVIKWY